MAKLFQHGGSQAVHLPKAFRFEGTEVIIEKRGDEAILRSCTRPKLKSLKDVAKYMRKNFPHGADFSDIDRPIDHQARDLTLD